MDNGLYFYKLVSPFSEDKTKDCKLTINEIDSNFFTLKEADITNVVYDKDAQVLSLTRKDGESMTASFEGVTQDLDVKFYSEEGTLKLSYNGKEVTIKGIVTQDNIAKDRATQIKSDSTLRGWGNSDSPLMLAYVDRTGYYKPAIKLIDVANGEFLPNNELEIRKGDRYVTHEIVGDFGYLYNFASMQKINEDLPNGWRVPTKADWDAMLNAVEPCDGDKNHDSAVANNMLGKYAGKLLKTNNGWKPIGVQTTTEVENEDDLFDAIQDGQTVVTSSITCTEYVQDGVDAYGFSIKPAGFTDGVDVSSYFQKRAYFWTNTSIDETDVYVKRFDYNREGVVQTVESPRSYFSIRLVKDFDGDNQFDVEDINGVNYHTVLLPSTTAPNGYAVWTSENVCFNNAKYCPVSPNRGEGLNSHNAYYILDWTGDDWEKKEMGEGEAIVLLNGLSGETDESYRIVSGTMVDEAHIIEEKVYEEILPKITLVDELVGSGFTESIPVYLVDDDGNYILDAEGNKIVDYYITKRITITDKVTEIDKRLGEGFSGDSVTAYVKKNLKDIEALNAELDEEEETRANADIALQDNIDTVIAGVGLEEDGTFVPNSGANYIASAETVIDAINKLDEVAKSEEDRIAHNEEEIANLHAKDEELDGHVIKSEQPDDAYNLNEGILTLTTNDPANNVIVKLSSNYGNLEDFVVIKPEDVVGK